MFLKTAERHELASLQKKNLEKAIQCLNEAIKISRSIKTLEAKTKIKTLKRRLQALKKMMGL